MPEFLEKAQTYLYTLVAKFLSFVEPYPYLNKFCELHPNQILAIWAAAAAILLLLVVLILVKSIKFLSYRMLCNKVQKSFQIADLHQFKVHKMGKPDTKYYSADPANTYVVFLPHWKHQNSDGTRKKKLFNHLVWEECSLWLHLKKKTYVLCTDNPWDMIYLVHSLRDSGVQISPCRMESAKQAKIEDEKPSTEDYIQQLIATMDGEAVAYEELCKESLEAHGCKVLEAPGNTAGIRFFIQKTGKPRYVKCLFVPRKHLTSIEDMKQMHEAIENDLFGDAGLLITTGHITIAAANYARAKNIEVILDNQLVEFTDNSEKIDPAKEFLRWELTEKDIKAAMPEDAFAKAMK